jgi:hypothetical protein
LASVDAIVAQGGSVTDAFERTRAGWKATMTTPTIAELDSAIIVAIASGDALEVERAMTAARIGTISAAPIRGRVARAVLLALKTAYAESASANYSTVASKFDEAAARITQYAAVVDLELAADAVVSLDAKSREAWMNGAIAARELDSALEALIGAAALAGAQTRDNDGRPLTGALIGLCCDCNGVHRRRAHEAWAASKGRVGRWAGLLALGVTLRAATLDGFEPYREPRPLEVRQVRSGMGVRQVTVDPEDQDYQPVSTDHRTPAEIASAKATVDAWNKLGQPKTTAATE